MRIALTHIPGRLEGLQEALQAEGHAVVHAPLIEAHFIADADLSPINGCPWWVFTSRTAIEAVAALHGFERAPGQIAVVGRATARALLDLTGLEAAAVARVETAVELARQLIEDGARGPFGWPRGEGALMGLKRTLDAAGETVCDVVVYRSEERKIPPLEADVIVLASPSAAHAVPLESARGARLVALGSSTATGVTARGLQVHTCAEPSVRGVLEVVHALNRQHPETPGNDARLETA